MADEKKRPVIKLDQQKKESNPKRTPYKSEEPKDYYTSRPRVQVSKEDQQKKKKEAPATKSDIRKSASDMVKEKGHSDLGSKMGQSIAKTISKTAYAPRPK